MAAVRVAVELVFVVLPLGRQRVTNLPRDVRQGAEQVVVGVVLGVLHEHIIGRRLAELETLPGELPRPTTFSDPLSITSTQEGHKKTLARGERWVGEGRWGVSTGGRKAG
jgi:hypothetical protein